MRTHSKACAHTASHAHTQQAIHTHSKPCAHTQQAMRTLQGMRTHSKAGPEVEGVAPTCMMTGRRRRQNREEDRVSTLSSADRVGMTPRRYLHRAERTGQCHHHYKLTSINWSFLKPIATSDRRQATSDKRQATSNKQEANTSDDKRRQAMTSDDKRQATSDKRQPTTTARAVHLQLVQQLVSDSDAHRVVRRQLLQLGYQACGHTRHLVVPATCHPSTHQIHNAVMHTAGLRGMPEGWTPPLPHLV